MSKTIYRISIRKQAGRSTTGQFKARHELPKLVEVPDKPAAGTHADGLRDRIYEALSSFSGSAPVDRIVIERIGTL